MANSVHVILSLGSNLHPRPHLRMAIGQLRTWFGDLAISRVYRMPAIGFEGPAFLNAAVGFDTTLPFPELVERLHALEDAAGRQRGGPKFSDRTLDIDVVFYGDRIIDSPSGRIIPRPELRHAFVLMPAAEIAPDFIDPSSGRSLHALWQIHPQITEAFETVSL